MLEEETPVGAVILHHGRMIASAHNQREQLKDPTAHAEILAITQAAVAMDDWRLTDCTLYVTLEPCCMCAGAIVQARIPQVVLWRHRPQGRRRAVAVPTAERSPAEPSRRSHRRRTRPTMRRIADAVFSTATSDGKEVSRPRHSWSGPKKCPGPPALVPVDALLLARRRRKSIPPRRGWSPSSGAPRQKTWRVHPATTGRVPVERCSSTARTPRPSRHDGARPRRAMLLASTTPRALPATTGLVPVERCSSPARTPSPSRHDGARPRRAMLLASMRPETFPPRRGSSPSSDAPRQQASPSPSRHDGARPRRAMLLASTRPETFPPRRGSSPSSDAPRQKTSRVLPATTGLVPNGTWLSWPIACEFDSPPRSALRRWSRL